MARAARPVGPDLIHAVAAEAGGSGRPLVGFLARRAELSEPQGPAAGVGLCHALSDALDADLTALFAGRSGAALVAVGGYGRRELCLHSDVDLMILHNGGLDRADVQSVFYPLWDAKLRVGHSVRTVREAVAAARENLETLTALLTSRLVTGDAELLAEVEHGLAGLLRREHHRITEAVLDDERKRRRREPYQLLAADLKGGRGGLRALATLGWDRRRLALLDHSDPHPPDEAEDSARDVLLAVRNALHAATGRATDVYAFELRPRVALWLESDQITVGRRLYPAMRAVERRVEERWPNLMEAIADPVAGLGRWVVRAVRSRTRRSEPEMSPGLAEAVRAVDGRRPLTSEEERTVIEAQAPAWTDADRAELIRLLAAGGQARAVLERLGALGWLAKAIPGWDMVTARPQLAPFHLHPVDTHLWRTVDELLAVTGPDGDERRCREVAGQLGSLDEVLLAGFLHDLGKGVPGDHSVTGARLAKVFGERAGFSREMVGMIERAVRLHLLLPDTATRRDIHDARQIEAVAETVRDLDLLRTLYLLAVADARATGPGVWSAWKASLVADLYERVADVLAGSPPVVRDGLVRRVVEASGGRRGAAEVSDHLARLPDDDVRRFTAEEIALQLDLTTPPPVAHEARVLATPAEPASRVMVCGRDRPGFLTTVAGVFALHRLGILDARVSTTRDGLALNTFYVSDAVQGGVVDEARARHVADDLTAVLTGRLDLEAALADKAHAYRQGVDLSIGVVVTVEPIPVEGLTVVEVRGPDRLGLLYDLGRVFVDLGLDIHLAKIDTRGREVVDTFYVRLRDGRRMTEDARTALRTRLGRAADPQWVGPT